MSEYSLRELECFLTVAGELSFTRAAERLRLAPPPLSRHIQNLEEKLGVLLFERSRRNVALTPAGLAFREEAKDILPRRGSEARVTGGNGSARRGIRECGPLSRAGRGLYRLPETVSEDSTAIARSIAFGSVGSSRKKRAGYRIYRSRTRKVIGGDRGNPMERGGPFCICSTRP